MGQGLDFVTDILLVDYDDAVRTSTAEILRQEGFSVAEVDRADVVATLLQERWYRLMVIDPDLPLGDGIDLLDGLAEPPQIIVVSAHPVEKAARDRLDAKVALYLEKPVAPPVLVAAVRGAIH